jgi:hypothetical protein
MHRAIPVDWQRIAVGVMAPSGPFCSPGSSVENEHANNGSAQTTFRNTLERAATVAPT